MSEEEPQSPKGLPLRPESLMLAGLGLSVVLVLLLTARTRTLERENELLRLNYQGLKEVHNRSKSPCVNCSEKEVSQNGNTGLYPSETPSSVPTPE